MGRHDREETSVFRSEGTGVKAKSIGKTDVHRSLPPPKTPLLPLFLVPTVCFENSCTESGSNWGAAMHRCNCSKGREGLWDTSPRATIPPQENLWDTRDNSGMNLTQIWRQIQHRACPGRKVSTVELA